MGRIALALIFALVGNLAQASQYMQPRPLPLVGPWFDGWYIRVTDVANKRSFATITTSATNSYGEIIEAKFPGYVALLVSQGPSQPTRSVEYFPEKTELGSPEGALFSAEGFGNLTEDKIDLKFPSGDEVLVDIGARVPWSAGYPDTWGPQGYTNDLPFVPLGWWVESLGSPVTYSIKTADGQILKGTGFAHIERSWGKTFPSAWMWVQATSEDNSAHLALAGGPLRIGFITLESFLVGYKSALVDFELRPDQGPFARHSHEIDACKGTFKLVAKNLRQRLEISASAAPSSFAPVSIPTDDGYVPNGGKESFSTTIEVKAYRDNQLIETKRFQHAALEFGANYMNCP